MFSLFFAENFEKSVEVVREMAVQAQNGYHISNDDLIKYRQAKIDLQSCLDQIDMNVKQLVYSRKNSVDIDTPR